MFIVCTNYFESFLKLSKFKICFFLFLVSSIGWSKTDHVYSFNDAFGVSTAETVTASGDPFYALLYNPSLMANTSKGTTYPLAGVSILTSPSLPFQSMVTIDKDVFTQKKIDVQKLIKELDTYLSSYGQRLDAKAKVEAEASPMIVAPYFGVSPIAQANVSTWRTNYNDPYASQAIWPDTEESRRLILVESHVGAVVGLAASYRRFSAGYSLLSMTHSSILTSLNDEEYIQVREKIANETFDENSIDWKNHTTANFGSIATHNAGVAYRPFEKNDSRIGVSVLNISEAQFNKGLSNRLSLIPEGNERFTDAISRYGVIPETPKAWPQLVNAGVLGYLGTTKTIFAGILSVDYHGLFSNHLNFPLSAMSQINFRLPEKAVKLLNNGGDIGAKTIETFVRGASKFGYDYVATWGLSLNIGMPKVKAGGTIDGWISHRHSLVSRGWSGYGAGVQLGYAWDL